MIDCFRKEACKTTSSNSAQSWTLRAIGPKWSIDVASDTAPEYGTRLKVGFRPTMPHQDAGTRIEPPWSPPIAMSTSRVDTCSEYTIRSMVKHIKADDTGIRPHLIFKHFIIIMEFWLLENYTRHYWHQTNGKFKYSDIRSKLMKLINIERSDTIIQ